jgi:bacteriocin biosynthesis cyclodehydratase domain-containing protein
MNTPLTAAALDAATQDDAQFQIPRMPRAVAAVPTTWLGDTYVIEGVVSRRVLRGRTVQRLLPDLFPLLDGTRTWEELAAGTGVAESTIRQVLGILYSAGLLEDGDAPLPSSASPLSDFLSRTADATRHHRSGWAAEAALESAAVGVLGGDSSVERDVIAALRRAHLSVVPVDDFQHSAPGLVVAVSIDGVGPDARTIASLRARGVPILPVALRADEVALGPVSYPDHNPCVDCTARGLAGVDEGRSETTRGPAAPLRALVPAFIAQEAVLLVAGVGTARTTSETIVIGGAPLSTRFELVTRRPGCSTCGTNTASGDGGPAFAYEESVAFPPARLTKPRTHQQHFEPANIALSTEQRRTGGVRLPLPVDFEGPRPSDAAGALAHVLATGFALKPPHLAPDGKVRRWAPTGGNLGSPQAYFTTRDVPHMPDGRWMYRGDDSSARRLGDAEDGVRGVELVVVSEMYRVWKKYNTFAYRIVALDAGVAMAHVAISATNLGLPLTNHLGWDVAELMTRYELDENEQMVTGLLSIGVPA